MPRRLVREVKVYSVGGAVRDGLLGRPVADRDWVVVGATPEMMVASGYRAVGNDFPVFLHPETQEEHALARTERKHGTGYRGFEFFASPDVTLEEDLARRDLTINAMARDEHGTLIDPYDGQGDLARGVLRHVSPAFAEDPLRVLRVARFAARLGFDVAHETLQLMREIAASGELTTLSAERVWRELATGLMEATPSHMLAVLRDCGALTVLLPEVDQLFLLPASHEPRINPGEQVASALDYAAGHGFELPVRYAVLTQNLGAVAAQTGTARQLIIDRTSMRLSALVSNRLRVPLECRDAAYLAARFHARIADVGTWPPARLLDLLIACDALRRPQRLRWLAAAARSDACSVPGGSADYAPASLIEQARDVVVAIDSGVIAREVQARGGRSGPVLEDDQRRDAIKAAVRRARLAALSRWKRELRHVAAVTQ